MSPSRTPIVELLYTRGLVLWANDTPGFGGYYARSAGFPEQGQGRTVDQALERLAAAMWEHVENWDAEMDEHAHARHRVDRCKRLGEPPLVSWVRTLGSDELLNALRSAAEPPKYMDVAPAAPSPGAVPPSIALD